MPHLTNFVHKLPIFSILGACSSLVMSYPIFNPSNPLVGPKTHPYPSKYLPQRVFFLIPHPQNRGEYPYFPFNTYSLMGGAGGGKHYIAIYSFISLFIFSYFCLSSIYLSFYLFIIITSGGFYLF